MAKLDAHAKPLETLKRAYKIYQKHPTSLNIIDPVANIEEDGDLNIQRLEVTGLPAELRQVFLDFLTDGEGEAGRDFAPTLDLPKSQTAFAVPSIPGLTIFPSLFPPSVQLKLLDKVFHRDLSNPEHKTNVHMHYDVPYPRGRSEDEDSGNASYFDTSGKELIFYPKDPSIHNQLTTQQYLNKKLRWMTLGGQYDWTNKVYPEGKPPPFPSDIKGLIEATFPMKAEAAIVNLYSPGDTLSLHRDVSEECDQPLVSISLGCVGIFVVGLEGLDEFGRTRVQALRLRSGDAVLMSGESRYAWHGVPAVLEGTCPDWMEDWPFGAGESGKAFEQRRGWMKGKRVNLNIDSPLELHHQTLPRRDATGTQTHTPSALFYILIEIGILNTLLDESSCSAPNNTPETQPHVFHRRPKHRRPEQWWPEHRQPEYRRSISRTFEGAAYRPCPRASPLPRVVRRDRCHSQHCHSRHRGFLCQQLGHGDVARSSCCSASGASPNIHRREEKAHALVPATASDGVMWEHMAMSMMEDITRTIAEVDEQMAQDLEEAVQ